MRATIQIVDWATREPVEAELFDEVTVEHFLETQNEWRPVVVEAAKKMVQSGSPRETLPLGLDQQRGRSANPGVLLHRNQRRRQTSRSDEVGECGKIRENRVAERQTPDVRGLSGDGAVEYQIVDAGIRKESRVCSRWHEAYRSSRAQEP